MTELNPYTLLGVARTATAAEINAAYRTMAKIWHPDHCKAEAQRAAAEAHFKRIGSAYEILKDPEKRRILDAELDRPEPFLPQNRVRFDLTVGRVGLSEADIVLRNDGGPFSQVGFDRTEGGFWRIFPPADPNIKAHHGQTVAVLKVVQAYPIALEPGRYSDSIRVFLDDRPVTLEFEAAIR